MTSAHTTPPIEGPILYPWGDALPAPGVAMPLRPGLNWLRMPLPFALNHINLWALDDTQGGQAGWTVVDAGIASEPIRQAWQTLWQGPLSNGPLQRVVVTHMHPDHVGNAAWLIEHFSPNQSATRLWMSATDHLAALQACEYTSSQGGEHAAAFFASHGLSDQASLDRIRMRGGYYQALVPSIPRMHHRLIDGMQFDIGERRWRCIAGYGHSPEHMALYNERDGLLISGDMLLPTISTNVSVYEMEPDGDPLGLFLHSIERMRELPDDTLALPSHGRPFTGIHTRIGQLQAHHSDRLTEVMQACQQSPSSASDVLPVLFKRKLDLHQTTFAMGEAVAHLNHLWHRGELVRTQDASGVWRFTPG
jgi:glyoxylase-like metal-dependent hydrolase (beta-lactamase superfamily II)